MEDLVLKWVQVCVGRGDLIKAMEREGHKWFESADRLPSTLLKCTATFFLLPSHQSGDCLSLISHLSLQPFATCSFYLEIKPRPGTAESPLTCTTMSRFILSQWNRLMSTGINDAAVVTCLFHSSAFLFVWREQRSLFILHCRTKYYHRPNWIKQSSCLSCWGSLSLEIEENRERGKEKPNGAKRKWET